MPDAQPTTGFISYVRRRQSKMISGGVAAVFIGIVVIVADHKTAGLNIAMGAVILLGVVLVLSSLSGRRLLREIDGSLAGPSRTMELHTYGYRTMRSVYNNRVLATLDDVGSTNRTPRIEFKAVWFTPGIAAAPAGEARVFGGDSSGQAVLAIAESGGVMGRVKRVRPN